jgi:hypothetical protein
MIHAVWDWCKRSATIVGARLQYVGGIIGAGLVATFSGYDFTALVTMDAKAAFKMLVAIAIAGVLTELCRRRTLPKG